MEESGENENEDKAKYKRNKDLHKVKSNRTQPSPFACSQTADLWILMMDGVTFLAMFKAEEVEEFCPL